MKKIAMVGVSILLITACGGSSSPKKGPLSSQNPINRIEGGEISFQRYILTIRPDAQYPWCKMAKGFLIIKNNIVSGTVVSGFPKPYVIFGNYIPETGKIEGGFPKGQPISHYVGMLNPNIGSGTWSDDFGCSGQWEAVVKK